MERNIQDHGLIGAQNPGTLWIMIVQRTRRVFQLTCKVIKYPATVIGLLLTLFAHKSGTTMAGEWTIRWSGYGATTTIVATGIRTAGAGSWSARITYKSYGTNTLKAVATIQTCATILGQGSFSKEVALTFFNTYQARLIYAIFGCTQYTTIEPYTTAHHASRTAADHRVGNLMASCLRMTDICCGTCGNGTYSRRRGWWCTGINCSCSLTGSSISDPTQRTFATMIGTLKVGKRTLFIRWF